MKRVSLERMLKIPAKLYLIFVITLANFWIWKIFGKDLILGIVLVLLSLALFTLSNIKSDKKNSLLTLLFIIFISSQILISGIDKDLTILSSDQQKTIGDRHGYYSVELGRLFQNKFTLRFYKDFYPYISAYEENVFNALSPNLYFFNSHPREREKIGEFAKYPAILILPFIFGLFMFIQSSNNILIQYLFFAILTTGLIKQNYLFGPILFFPFINILITNGLMGIYRKIRK